MNFLKSKLPFVALLCALSATAADLGKPIVTFKTTLYDDFGTQNAFHFQIGATEQSYFDIDFGFGAIETEVGVASFDSSESAMKGSTVTGTVSEEGTVRIYGDPSKIDYLDLEGVYITQLDIQSLTNLQILNLNHNLLESLDLTPHTKLMALYINDNPFNVSPLVVGTPKPELQIAEMNILGALDPNFNLADYPAMLSFDAYATHSLTKCDPTNCPELLKLSIDLTNVSSIDVSKNPKLLILNVSETKVTSLDLSNNPYLTELYCTHTGSYNSNYKFTELDLSHNPELVRLYCGGNSLTDLDISAQTKLVSFGCNRNLLPGISFAENPDLYSVDISNNLMDFDTMPLPRETFNEYYYWQQQMPVARSFPVNQQLDFSRRVLRVGGETWCALFACQTDEEGMPVNVELDQSYYTFDQGRVTLLKESTDSLYLAFANELFPDYDIRTQCFMVKSPENYGKDNPVVSLSAPVGTTLDMAVGLRGATADSPVAFSVDFGDGSPVQFNANAQQAVDNNASGTVSGTVTIFIPEGMDITSLSVDGIQLSSINLTAASALQHLSLTNCGLKDIDLRWNRCLVNLNLKGNALTSLNVEGIDGSYGKNVLQTINAADNALTYFGPYATDAHTIDVSNNQLESFPLAQANLLQNLNVSGNRITELNLDDCESLSVLNAADNNLSAIPYPITTTFTELNISGNRIPLTALPVNAAPVYTYAPQQPWVIPTKAPTVNLTGQLLDVQGKSTSFAWYNAEDNTPVDHSMISEEKPGIFKFAGEEVGTVYCAMTHPLFPDFETKQYVTTSVSAAEVPTHVVCKFTTAETVEKGIVTLTAAQPNTTVFIDWTGNGDLQEYLLSTSYIPFEVSTTAGTTCTVYSYDDNDGVSVFSLNVGKLDNVDASEMKQLTTFTLLNAGIAPDQVKFPVHSPLQEVSVTGSQFTSLDPFIPFAGTLTMIGVGHNQLTEVDLSPFAKLNNFYAGYNKIESIKFNNPLLWETSLEGNQFKEIDFTGAPKLSQISLFDNYLSSIDLTPMERVILLDISTNCFDFNTLPANEGFILYIYGNQRPITATVTDQAQVDLDGYGAQSFRWFIGTPGFDEEGNLAGEELVLNEEYTLEGGVTTFLRNFHHIMCVMTNEAFPSLYLYTDFLDVTTAGIDTVAGAETFGVSVNGNTISATAPATLYNAAGQILGHGTSFTGLNHGIYIVSGQGCSRKVSL